MSSASIRRFSYIVFFFLFYNRGEAQTDSSLYQRYVDSLETKTAVLPQSSIDNNQFSPLRFTLVSAASMGILTLAHVQNYSSWWKGEMVPLHLCRDEAASLHADKFGHLHFTYIVSDLLHRSFLWSGIGSDNSFLYAGALAFGFQLYVEIEDGFHPTLGFSLGDILADATGAVFPYLRERYQLFRPITLKWSALASPRYKAGEFRTLLDDYESQYYWLSFNLHDIFEDDLPIFIPQFLNVAIGYGVKDLDGQSHGTHELFLSVDCDVRKLPGEGDILTSLKHILNYLHFPSPTIRLTPEVTLYGIRF